jgi:hypothetical protein
MWIDVHRENLSDLQGASRTIGGVFRGRAHGNMFNLGDSEEVSESNRPMMGKLKVFGAGQDPSANKPQMALRVKIAGSLAPVLGQLAKRYSPVESKQLQQLLYCT